jgi:hypothetical protein
LAYVSDAWELDMGVLVFDLAEELQQLKPLMENTEVSCT